LVWVPTSPLFQDLDEPYAHTRHIQRSKAHHTSDSEEENFDLPSSGEFSQDDSAEHGSECNDANELEGTPSRCGEPDDLSTEGSRRSDSIESNASHQDASSNGDLYLSNMEPPLMDEPYGNEQFSGMHISFSQSLCIYFPSYLFYTDPDDSGSSTNIQYDQQSSQQLSMSSMSLFTA
jgi:hypothetical protein